MSRPFELKKKACLKLHTDTFLSLTSSFFDNGHEDDEAEGCSDVFTVQPSLVRENINHYTTLRGFVDSEKCTIG